MKKRDLAALLLRESNYRKHLQHENYRLWNENVHLREEIKRLREPKPRSRHSRWD